MLQTLHVNTVTVVGEHVHWHASVIDDPSARAVLDLLFALPDRRGRAGIGR
jgi:hypothetical protein